MKSLFLTLALVVFATTTFAQPTLGPDCPADATIVGSNNAGKITINADPWGASCTLTFTGAAKNRACSAMNETAGGGPYARPLGAVTTDTTVTITSVNSVFSGDVISYMCLAF